MLRPTRPLWLRSTFVAACALAVGAGSAHAHDGWKKHDSKKDESKIQLRMDPVAAGDDLASIKTQMQDGRARLDLWAKRLAPDTEYVLKLDDDRELARFTTGKKGYANVRVNLLKSGGYSAPPIDPRNHELFLADPNGDVLAAWLYGAVADDPSWVHIKEQTGLEPTDLADRGAVSARYELQPNGKARFLVQTRHVPRGDYDLYVGDLLVASFTTNPAGNAQLQFRSDVHGQSAAMKKNGDDDKDDDHGNGNGKAKGDDHGKPDKVHGGKPNHNQKLALDFDPRNEIVELRRGADVYFSGPMLARIDGLNECREKVKEIALEPADPASTAIGTLLLGREEDCERNVGLAVEGLLAGTYDLLVDGVVVGQIEVPTDGAPAEIHFANTPDEPGELPLDFDLACGSLVEVGQAGVVVLGVLLP